MVDRGVGAGEQRLLAGPCIADERGRVAEHPGKAHRQVYARAGEHGEAHRELSWAPGSCCGFANRGDPPGYRASFRCRSFLLRTDETSRAVSSTWIGAQADSQSARKNARGPENLKNEQHKWR